MLYFNNFFLINLPSCLLDTTFNRVLVQPTNTPYWLYDFKEQVNPINTCDAFFLVFLFLPCIVFGHFINLKIPLHYSIHETENWQKVVNNTKTQHAFTVMLIMVTILTTLQFGCTLL